QAGETNPMLARLGILLTCSLAAGGLAGSAAAASGHAASRAPRNVLTRTNWAPDGHHRHACVRRQAGRKHGGVVRCGSHIKSTPAKRILARAASRKHHKSAKPASVAS